MFTSLLFDPFLLQADARGNEDFAKGMATSCAGRIALPEDVPVVEQPVLDVSAPEAELELPGEQADAIAMPLELKAPAVDAAMPSAELQGAGPIITLSLSLRQMISDFPADFYTYCVIPCPYQIDCMQLGQYRCL
jgi:hypothetical protein